MPTIIIKGVVNQNPRRISCPECTTVFDAWYKEFIYHYKDGGGGKYSIGCPLISCNHQFVFTEEEMDSLLKTSNTWAKPSSE